MRWGQSNHYKLIWIYIQMTIYIHINIYICMYVCGGCQWFFWSLNVMYVHMKEYLNIFWHFFLYQEQRIHSIRSDINAHVWTKMSCGGISKSKVVSLSRGWPKALFSIATTTSCREGSNSFFWIAPLYPWS